MTLSTYGYIIVQCTITTHTRSVVQCSSSRVYPRFVIYGTEGGGHNLPESVCYESSINVKKKNIIFIVSHLQCTVNAIFFFSYWYCRSNVRYTGEIHVWFFFFYKSRLLQYRNLYTITWRRTFDHSPPATCCQRKFNYLYFIRILFIFLNIAILN